MLSAADNGLPTRTGPEGRRFVAKKLQECNRAQCVVVP